MAAKSTTTPLTSEQHAENKRIAQNRRARRGSGSGGTSVTTTLFDGINEDRRAQATERREAGEQQRVAFRRQQVAEATRLLNDMKGLPLKVALLTFEAFPEVDPNSIGRTAAALAKMELQLTADEAKQEQLVTLGTTWARRLLAEAFKMLRKQNVAA